MAKLLFLSHTPSENTSALRDACLAGIQHPDIENIEVTSCDYLSASADDVLWCDGIILGTTENFGYMAGLMKDFFERIYYPCLEKTRALPCALYIRAGLDGQGTKVAVEKILTGLRWKLVQEALILKGDYQESFKGEVKELGMNFSAGLEAGIF
jgi:multimeric flavodoxin WrbA